MVDLMGRVGARACPAEVHFIRPPHLRCPHAQEERHNIGRKNRNREEEPVIERLAWQDVAKICRWGLPLNRRFDTEKMVLGIPRGEAPCLAIELEAASQRIAKQKVAQTEVRANPRGNRTRRSGPGAIGTRGHAELFGDKQSSVIRYPDPVS